MGRPTICVLMLMLASSTPEYLQSAASDKGNLDHDPAKQQNIGQTESSTLGDILGLNTGISTGTSTFQFLKPKVSARPQQFKPFTSRAQNQAFETTYFNYAHNSNSRIDRMNHYHDVKPLSDEYLDRKDSVSPTTSIPSFLSLFTSYLFVPSVPVTPSVPSLHYKSHRPRNKRSFSQGSSAGTEHPISVTSNGSPLSMSDNSNVYSLNLTLSKPNSNGVETPGSYTEATPSLGVPPPFDPDTPRTTLRIGGLFELSGKYGGNGFSELDAANLAVSHINDQNVIPGYKLELLYNNSKCDPGVGTDAFFDFIYRRSQESSLLMVMGSACTEVTKTIAEIVPYWNLILISYAAKSPALSEREKYRTFFRLALGDSALNPARRMLIKHFLWDKVAALYEDLESLSLSFNEINDDFSSHDIVIKSSTSFKDAAVELPGKLKEMRDLDVRIIIAGFTELAARQVFCEAYKQGMYGERYVWILVGGFKHQWWNDAEDTPCFQSQLAAAVEGVFTVFSPNGLLDGGKSVGNLTSSEFLSAYFNANGSRPLSMFAASTYDTVWTIALTLRQAIEKWAQNGTAPLLHQLRYDTMGDVKETFISTMENLEFPGVSGPVSFKGSDREGVAVVYQIQGGNFTQVAVHQPTSSRLNFDCELCHSIVWQGGRVPKDEQVVVPRLKMIELSVFYSCTGLCVGGIILAVCFLTYNLYHRRLKFIKLSSPKLNNVAVIGCILVYTAVIMLGVDDRTLTQDSFPIVCSARAFLLAAGFSLAFGAMFAKTFRVHQIFTRAHHGLVKSKLIQDTHLLIIIGVLLAVDSALVFVWVIVDPMRRHVTNTTTEVSAEDEDLIFQEQLATCHSNHLQKWLGAFYAYKGLLLIFGVYMAWETRHVKIPALNDSQYIGLNVYNVVIMSVSVVVISNILSSQPTLAYAMEAAFMFLSTTVTLCLLFVPKIYAIVTSGGNPVIASMGIVVDNSNTRRFVFDDRKEIYYRAEVQNRVYKRELVELEQQIVRLERLLEIPLQPYPRLTEELLYLLPESKVDGTPRCHRRYKRELERCNSISDGGEGVTFDISENDDILMEMAFSAGLSPKTSINKRHSTAETSKPGSRALQKLTRSFSIGGGGASFRGRRRKKGRSSSKSLLPFSTSESSFQKNRDASDKDGVSTLVVHSPKPNRYSDDLTYLQMDKYLCSDSTFRKNSSVPMLDKITQTSCDSASKVSAGDKEKMFAEGRDCDDTGDVVPGQMLSDSSYEGDDDEDSLFLEFPRNAFHSKLLKNAASSRLFAVRQLQIESVDEDSNSTNTGEDTESVGDLTSASLSKSTDAIFTLSSDDQRQTNTRTDRPYSDSVCFQPSGYNPNSPPVQKQLFHYTLSPESSYEKGQRLEASLSEFRASNPCFSASSERHHDDAVRPRSISSPSPPTAISDTPRSLQPRPAASELLAPPLASTNTTTTKTPELQQHHPAPTTISCLNQNLVRNTPRIYTDDVFTHNLPTDYGIKLSGSAANQQPSLFEEDTTTQQSQDHSQYFPLTSPSQDRSHTKENVSAPSESSTFNHSHSRSTSLSSQSTSFSLGDKGTKSRQVQSSDSRSPYRTPTGIKVTLPAPYPTSSQGASPLLSRGNIHLPETNGSNSTQLKTTAGVADVERKKRIQKLQEDLVRIQRELQDLNDFEYDVSEV